MLDMTGAAAKLLEAVDELERALATERAETAELTQLARKLRRRNRMMAEQLEEAAKALKRAEGDLTSLRAAPPAAADDGAAAARDEALAHLAEAERERDEARARVAELTDARGEDARLREEAAEALDAAIGELKSMQTGTAANG